MMRHALLLGLLVTATLLSAQYQDYSRMGRTPAELMFIEDPLEIELKEPSWWFHNPKKDTPAEQLQYAQGLEAEGKLKKALEAYDDLVHEWHATPQALRAQLSVARLYAALNDSEEAYNEDIYLLAHFSGRFDLEVVLKDAVAQADALTAGSKTGFLGLRSQSRKSLRTNYERIIHFAPRWPRVPELLMRIAALYSEEEAYASAITVYDNIIVKWPIYARLDDVVYLYAEACRKQADLWRNDTGRLHNLERLIAGAITFRPAHAQRKTFQTWCDEIYVMRRDASYAKACFYDNPQAYSVDAAIRAYQAFLQQFPDALQAETVRNRIAELSLLTRTANDAAPAENLTSETL